MKQKFLQLSTLCILSLPSILWAQSKVDANSSIMPPPSPEKELPETIGAIVFKNKPAYLKTGCNFRKALGGLVTVYEVCMNLKGGKASQWMDAFVEKNSHSFLLTLDFKRGVGGKKVSEAFAESLAKTPAIDETEKNEREKFLKWVEGLEVNKSDVFDLFFNDEGRSFVMLYESKGKKTLTFESAHRNFSKSVAMIWLGPNSISEDIKKSLLKD